MNRSLLFLVVLTCFAAGSFAFEYISIDLLQHLNPH